MSPPWEGEGTGLWLLFESRAFPVDGALNFNTFTISSTLATVHAYGSGAPSVHWMEEQIKYLSVVCVP